MEQPEILYEDDAIIVVHKASGVAVESGRVSEPDMVSILRAYLRTDYIGTIHRLDQPVEGILVFGRTRQAAAGLSSQLKEGIFNKRYDVISVTDKEDLPEEGRLTDRMDTDRKRNVSYITDPGGPGKEAVLEYRICRKWSAEEGGKLAHIKVDLFTGRRHQIRLQLSHAGMPVLGDRKYGETPAWYRGNICLAASELSFLHPLSGEKMEYRITPGFLKSVR